MHGHADLQLTFLTPCAVAKSLRCLMLASCIMVTTCHTRCPAWAILNLPLETLLLRLDIALMLSAMHMLARMAAHGCSCSGVCLLMQLHIPFHMASHAHVLAHSATLHLMIVVIHQLTERGFRSTFSAMVQSQGSCKGALAGATSDQQALQEAPLEKAGSPPASKAPPCPAPAPPSCYGSVKGSKKSVTGMLLSTDSKEGNILSPGSDVLTPGETGAASKGSEVINGRGEHGVESRGSEASRDSHRLVSERMHSSVAAGAVRAGPGRPKYKKQFQVHKVPGSAHPQSLPPTALPDLATLIHERWMVHICLPHLHSMLWEFWGGTGERDLCCCALARVPGSGLTPCLLHDLANLLRVRLNCRHMCVLLGSCPQERHVLCGQRGCE
eukprot:scaffold23004_cov19-Tisochrysis_lutea.AAC.1